MLQAALTSPYTDASKRLADALLAAAYDWRAWERALRARKAIEQAGLTGPAIRSLLAERSGWPRAVHAAVSMQRDGRLREAALCALMWQADRLALATLINRIADPVPAIAQRAIDTLTEQIDRFAPTDLVWALPLIDAMAQTVRGARSTLAAVIDQRLRRPEMAGALRRIGDHPDARLRYSAALRRIEYARTPEQLIATLDKALRDPSPVLRSRAAAEAIERCTDAQIEPLLKIMSAYGGPRARLMALRVLRRQGDSAAVARGCFDHNANVRFYARRYARALGKTVDFRALAWAILKTPTSTTRQQIGALAVLSEYGLGTDRAQLELWAHAPHTRVAAEARRTLSLLI